jgi:hypothetical protein
MTAIVPRLVAVAAAGVIATASSASARDTTTAKAGRWHGISWKFTAEGSFAAGSYCVAVTIRGREAARSCGPTPRRGITYLAYGGRPAVVGGPVISTARSVGITFFDRRAIRIPAIRARGSSDRSTRYFAAALACPAIPRSFVARNAAERVVARFQLARRLGPSASC